MSPDREDLGPDPEADHRPPESTPGDPEAGGVDPGTLGPGHHLVTSPPVGLGELADADIGELAARLEAHHREQAAEQAAQQLAAAAGGGPCKWCGVQWSPGGWYEGPTCQPCNEDRRVFGTGAVISDREHRGLVAWRLVAAVNPAEAAHWRPELLAERCDFRWWHETAGAPAGGRVRWYYTDPRVLLDRLQPPDQEGPRLVIGPPCGYCGGRRFRVRVRVAGAAGSVAFPPQVLHDTTCVGPCSRLGTDLDTAAGTITGLHPWRGLGEQLGLSWWRDHLEQLPLRRRLRARKDGPGGPLGWWPTKGAILARAWRLAGPREGEFASEVEARWVDLASMREAEDAAAVEALADMPPAEVE